MFRNIANLEAECFQPFPHGFSSWITHRVSNVMPLSRYHKMNRTSLISQSAQAAGSTPHRLECQVGPDRGSRRLSSPELSSRPKPAWLASP